MNKQVKVDFSTLYPLILDAVSQGKKFSFTAFGRSMHPYVRGGEDQVVLAPLTGPLKKGDVLFYQRSGGGFVLHRLIRVEKGQLVFCGDNQFVLEKGIFESQVIARLVERKRKGKTLSEGGILSRLWVLQLPLRRGILKGISILKRLIKKIGRMIHILN